MTDRDRLRIIEEWTGHRKPGNLPMQFARVWLLVALAALIVIFAGCAFEETTTTTTDAKSGRVTVEKKITKKADPAAWTLAGDVVAAYSPPRPRLVREEKSGPITPEEIAARWRAATRLPKP